jgi:crotonobetainyl-CoA:carnitine CoA-transferase CaiB-like acyl-CoA transferase
LSTPAVDPMAPSACGPLAGVKVLDLSAYIAGPYGCTLLADQGAEVLKVEPPEGDNLRTYPSTLAGESRAFVGVNRGKRGLALDLKQAAGLALLLRLVRDADVLVHNFRPGVPRRLGIAFEQLQALNPRLIYCVVSGYGESGPLKDKAGYDQVLQTLTGICTLQGKRGAPPEIVYGSIVDYYAAALVASGVSAALYERERSGLGQHVGISLMRSALAMQSARLIWADGEPLDIPRDLRSGGVTGLHPTRDGWLYLSASTPHFWRALCEKTGLAELLADPRLDSLKKRAEHAALIQPRLHQALAAKTALEWEAIFGDDVPAAAARRVEDMFEHPQVLAEQMVGTLAHATLGHYRGVLRAVTFGRTPGPHPRGAPALGEHSDEVAQDQGLSADEIAALRQRQVIR